MGNLSWTPHSSLEKDKVLSKNHSCVSPKMGCLEYTKKKRQDDDYMDIKVPEMQWPGKRKQGRPRRSYLDVLKEDMQEVGVREDEVFWM